MSVYLFSTVILCMMIRSSFV